MAAGWRSRNDEQCVGDGVVWKRRMLTTEAIITDIVRYDVDDIDYEPEFTEGIGAGAADLAW